MGRKTMSHRERVLTALEHREPDRVPLSMNPTVYAYQRLQEHMGLPIDMHPRVGRWTDVAVHPEIAERFGLDVLKVEIGSPHKKPAPPGPNTFYDEWHVAWRKTDLPGGGYYYEMYQHPLADATLADLAAFDWPDPDDDGLYEGIEARFREAREQTDFAIYTRIGGSVWEQAGYLVGLQRWFLSLAEDPAFATALLTKIADIQIAIHRRGLRLVGKYVDILRLSGEDLGTQQGQLISLPMFRRLVRPHLERVWRVAKAELLCQNPQGRIFLHSCGSVRPFMKDWADMGLDILDPIQPLAKNMDTAAIKADVGDRLAFHGGIDVQQVLPFGTPAEVREEVRHRIHDLAPGGGYIASPSHNVQADVPPANLIAMRDAVEEFGYYPIGG